jgi:hypothetical protein
MTSAAVPALLLYGVDTQEGEQALYSLRQRGIRPILGGQNASRVMQLSREFDLDRRIFPLHDAQLVARQLAGIHTLWGGCSLPIPAFRVLIEACLQQGVHYLDSGTDFSSIYFCQQRHRMAQQQECMLLPGLHILYVIAEGLSKQLLTRIPGASHLHVAISTTDASLKARWLSWRTHWREETWIIRNSTLVNVSHASVVRDVDVGFGVQPHFAVPTGLLMQLHHSTSIPNIDIVVPLSRRANIQLRLLGKLKKRFSHSDPSSTPMEVLPLSLFPTMERQTPWQPLNFIVQIEVVNQDLGHQCKEQVVLDLRTTPNQLPALLSIEAMLQGHIRHGFSTPSTSFGNDFYLQFISDP